MNSIHFFLTKSLNVRKMVLSAPLLSWLGWRTGIEGRGQGGTDRATGCPGRGPCAPPGVRFADLSDAVTAGAAAVQRLRDCVVLCWNSPRFDLRLGTPIAVERPCFGMPDFYAPLPISLDSKDHQVLADLLPAFLMFGRNFVICGVKFQQTLLCPCF